MALQSKGKMKELDDEGHGIEVLLVPSSSADEAMALSSSCPSDSDEEIQSSPIRIDEIRHKTKLRESSSSSACEDDFPACASFDSRSSVAPADISSCGATGSPSAPIRSGPDDVVLTAAFVTARSLLRSDVLSPGFRSAAAMAGWDDEALLLAAQELDEPASLAVGGAMAMAHDESRLQQQDVASPIVAKRPVRRNRERKREQRTPQQASTPLSAGRRSRKPRRQGIHGCSPEALPIGDLSLKEEFRTGMSEEDARKASATDDKNSASEAGDPPPASSVCLSAPIVESSENGVAIQATQVQDPKPPCLEKLREELSCAVCLEICYEPSSTSCGHSFCRECLLSVLQRCGTRCPKCRQQLRGEGGRGGCQVNVVLWNMVQLLFPQEVEARKEAAESKEGEARGARRGGVSERSRSVGSNGGGGVNSGSGGGWHSARAPVTGLLRRRGGAGTASARRVEAAAAPTSSSEAARERQILADAAFARQLQLQLNVHGGNSRSSRHLAGDVGGNLESAAANLRAVAQRVSRHRHS